MLKISKSDFLKSAPRPSLNPEILLQRFLDLHLSRHLPLRRPKYALFKERWHLLLLFLLFLDSANSRIIGLLLVTVSLNEYLVLGQEKLVSVQKKTTKNAKWFHIILLVYSYTKTKNHVKKLQQKLKLSLSNMFTKYLTFPEIWPKIDDKGYP